jgi:hypothetical protein
MGEVLVFANRLDPSELRELTLDARENLNQFRVRRADENWIRRATSAYEQELRLKQDNESRRLVSELARRRATWKDDLRQQIGRAESELTDAKTPPDRVLLAVERLHYLYRNLRQLEDEELEELRVRFADPDYRRELGVSYQLVEPEYLYVVLAYLAGSVSQEVVSQAVKAAVDFAMRWIKRRLKADKHPGGGQRVYILGPNGEVLRTVHLHMSNSEIMYDGKTTRIEE